MSKFYLIFNRLLFVLTLGLLMFIPLFPKLPLIPVRNSFVAIRLEDFLTALVFGIWFIYLILTKEYKNLFKNRLFQIIAVFFFIGFVSLISAVFLTKTVNPQLGMLHYLRRLEYILFLPLVVTNINSIRRAKITLYAFCIVIIIVLAYALGQQFLHLPVYTLTPTIPQLEVMGYVDQWTRVTSTFSGHYDLGLFILMILIILSSIFFYSFPKVSFKRIIFTGKVYHFIFILCLLGLSALVLILTGERLSFVAAILGVGALFILLGKKFYILFLVALTIFVLIYPSPLRDRFLSTFEVMFGKASVQYNPQTTQQASKSKLNISTLYTSTDPAKKNVLVPVVSNKDVPPDIVPGEPTDPNQLGVSRSIAIRLNQEWPQAIRYFLKNPLLGTGYSSIGLASDNDYLRSLAEVGILGTLSFALILVCLIRQVWKGYQSQDRFIHFFSAGILAMVIALLINALFTDVFEASKIAVVFWGFMGLAISLIKQKRINLQ